MPRGDLKNFYKTNYLIQNVVLKKETLLYQFFRTLTVYVRNQIKKKSQIVIYQKGKYAQSNIRQVFSMIEKLLIKKIQIWKNQDFKIIDIVHIQFQNLLQFTLKQTKISSVEDLQLVNFPKLRCLALCNNQITNLKSIRKICCFALQQIRFTLNFVYQQNFMRQMVSPNLKVLLEKPQNSLNSFDYFEIFASQSIQFVRIGELKFQIKSMKNEKKKLAFMKRFPHLQV